MSRDSEICDWLSLSLIPGLGVAGAARLVDYCGSVQDVLRADIKKLEGISGVRSTQLAGFTHLDECRARAAKQLEAVREMGGVVLTPDMSEYPQLLKEIADPPLVLYGLGDVSLLCKDLVAIVGSRSATAYGRRVSHSFAERLVAHDVIVVSGMALGIDSEAHCGALQAAGKTIGVLGCGLDIIYPRQNSGLYHEIAEKGLLLSEYPLGTRPEGFRFPARNRIIAGISLGVVVVEAARKSGSLITAQLALDFCREVFAVPGQIDSFKSEGTHWLLRQGAQLVVSGDDVVEGLAFTSYRTAREKLTDDRNPLSGLDPDAVALLEQLEPYPMSRDEVSDRAGFAPARLSELFLFLELEGHVEMLPGDMVRRLTDQMDA